MSKHDVFETQKIIFAIMYSVHMITMTNMTITRTRTKYTKHGVKRQHHIIDGILPLLEEISKIDGVKKVNPGKISYSPKRGISQPTIKIQRQTITGFKLLAHSKGAVQEIFIVVQNEKVDYVQNELDIIAGFSKVK